MEVSRAILLKQELKNLMPTESERDNADDGLVEIKKTSLKRPDCGNQQT